MEVLIVLTGPFVVNWFQVSSRQAEVAIDLPIQWNKVSVR
jgi:hypothetical protein